MQELLSLRWNIISFDENSVNKDISEIILSRFEDGSFLEDLTINDLHDPFLLKDMDKAVSRIEKVKEKDEKVIIFWDYDVDGVTATSLLVHFFTKIWLKVSYRIPDRAKDGYGLKSHFIDELSEIWVTLLITVDCWTRDIEVIKYAKEKWIDIIVTDHHFVPEIIPKEAVAIINPKRSDCEYLYKNLAWAWVALKLIQALSTKYFSWEEAKKYLQSCIDIAAIWTVADCMELKWENRIIVTEGLKQVKKSRSKWLKKLIEDKQNSDFDADIFAFQIWPKLNAAWRLDSPYKAVNLLLNNNDTVVKTISEIEKLNEKRKYLTNEFVTDALWKIKKDDNILFYVSPAIEHWIIWIVAWRLTENFYRPCICLKDEWDKLVASCRSPEYFSIIEILEKYKDYFLTFWGHKQAAGFSISRDKFAEFRAKILQEVNALNFSLHRKKVEVDKLISLEDIWFGFLDKINKFKPFWIWNPKPLFLIEDLEYDVLEFLGNWREHLRFTNKHWLKIFAFGFWEYYEDIKKAKNGVSIICDLSEDNWNGNKNILVKVVDVVVRNVGE